MSQDKPKRDHCKDCLTMRIKKVYFDRIIKDRETPLKYLYLHYQDKRGLVVKVKSVKIVKTPERLKESKIKFGPKVFEIKLGPSVLIEK